MAYTIVTKQSLVEAVKQYAATQKDKNFGWWEIANTNATQGDGQIVEIINDADAYNIVSAIAAVQAVVDALNED